MKFIVVIVLLLNVVRCVELASVRKTIEPSASTPKPTKVRRKTTLHPQTASTVRKTAFVLVTEGDDFFKSDKMDEGMNLEIKLKKGNKTKTTKPTKKENPKKKKAPAPTKKQPLKKDQDDEDEDDIFSDISQGYKKVYEKITHWWKDLEGSFSQTKTAEKGAKVKKDTKQAKAKATPTTKKPTTKAPVTKNKPQGGGTWFDLTQFVMVLGSIVGVLDLFGIR